MATHYEKFGRSYYERNKERVKAATKRNKQKSRDAWWEFKASLSCTICGEKHPATFDFHHPNRDEKDGCVNEFINQGRYGKAREEAAKCIVLCANCHRKLHWDERQKEKGAEAPFSVDSIKNQAAPGEP